MAYLTQYSNSVPVVKHPIDQVIMTIGQNIEMDICVPEDGVAENHAQVEVIKSAESYCFVIKSTENKESLLLNGEVVADAELQNGDWLSLGGVEFQFTDDGHYSFSGQAPASIESEENTNETKPKVVETPVKLGDYKESEALKLIRELKEDLQDTSTPLSTKEFIANSRQSRRRLAF